MANQNGRDYSEAFKRRRERPKVESEWPDDDVYKLIELIEERRPLWDGYRQSGYKQSRDILWQDIVESLDEKYSVSDCKAKWANLRVVFNTNLQKIRKSKDKKNVKWRFFLPMLFLEAADSTQPKSMEMTTGKPLVITKREIDSEWNDEDIYALIKLVEERPPLWDKLCVEYNRPKDFLWQEIEESLEEKFSLSECREKWLNLRVTYKTIKAKSKHGTKEDQEIDWPFYWDMNFLEPPNLREALDTRQSFSKELHRLAELAKDPKTAKKRRKQVRPSVQYEWNHAEIYKLIEVVKERPLLWNKDIPRYKQQKDHLWQEIVDAFERKFPLPECKAKWANLRVSFNYNLLKYRNLRSGQPNDEKNKISWRFFYPMLFLDSTDTQHSKHTDPQTEIESSNNFISGEEEEDFISENCSAESYAVASENSTRSNSPSPSRQSSASKKRCIETKIINEEASTKWIDPLGSTHQKDKYSIFGDYVAGELRSLEDSPDLLHKLKIFIQQKIIEVSSEHAARSFSQSNDNLENNTTTNS